MKGRAHNNYDLGAPAVEDASSFKGILIACCGAAVIWGAIALTIVHFA